MSGGINYPWLVKTTFQDPRQAADALRALNPPRQAIGLLFALVIVLSVMFQVAIMGLFELPEESGLTLAPVSPVRAAIDAAFVNAVVIFGLWRGGEAWGGRGTRDQTALLYLYLQAIGYLAIPLLMAATAVVFAILPPLAWILPLVVAGLMIWVNLSFIDQLHGFGSLGKTFGLCLAVGIGVIVAQIVFNTLTGGLVGG